MTEEPPARASRRVAVVGGGIAGLAAAEAFARTGAAVTLFEASARTGGRIGSRLVDGCLLESGPDGFFAGTPALEALVARLGLTGRLVEPQPGWAGLVRGSRIVRLPQQLWNGVPYRAAEILGAEALAPLARVRLLAEPFARRRSRAAESLDAFLVRRLGRGAARELVGPLLAGVHAGSAAELEAASVVPALVAAERDLGSVLRAARAAARAAADRADESAGRPATGRRPLRSFELGMGQLVDALRVWLTEAGVQIVRSASVRGLDQEPEGWRLDLADRSAGPFESVVLAVPPPAVGELLERVVPEAAQLASEIPTADAQLVHLLGTAPLEARYARLHGAIVPHREPGPLSGFSVASAKWPRRAPLGRLLVRASMRPGANVNETPTAIAGLLRLDRPPRILATEEHRAVWPVMRRGHGGLVRAFRDCLAAAPGLAVVGAAWDGVGLEPLVAAAGGLAED